MPSPDSSFVATTQVIKESTPFDQLNARPFEGISRNRKEFIIRLAEDPNEVRKLRGVIGDMVQQIGGETARLSLDFERHRNKDGKVSGIFDSQIEVGFGDRSVSGRSSNEATENILNVGFLEADASVGHVEGGSKRDGGDGVIDATSPDMESRMEALEGKILQQQSEILQLERCNVQMEARLARQDEKLDKVCLKDHVPAFAPAAEIFTAMKVKHESGMRKFFRNIRTCFSPGNESVEENVVVCTK